MYIIGNTIKSASEFEVYFFTKAWDKFSPSEKCSLVGSFECTSLQFLIVVIEYVYARVAQLVEYDLAKVGVAGSSPVSRLTKTLEYSRVLFICVIFRVAYF